MTFDQYEKERLVSVLGRVQLRMDFIETTMQDMLHKIKLMMIRDQSQQACDQQAPNHILTTMDTLMLVDEGGYGGDQGDNWDEDESFLQFPEITKNVTV